MADPEKAPAAAVPEPATPAVIDSVEKLTEVVQTAAKSAVIGTFASFIDAANGGASIKRTASVNFDTAKGKWIVAHKKLSEPMAFSSKKDAEQFRIALLAEDQPKVDWVAEEEAYKISHPDWEKPVVTKASEEATEIVEQKLVDKGWDGSEAKQRATELTTAARKEKIMASVEVTAAVKQNVKDGTVNIADHAGAKQDVKNADISGTGGTVVTEDKPAVAALDPGKSGPHALVQKHDGDYASLANKADALAKQVRSKDGLAKICSGLVDKYGADRVELAIKAAADMLEKTVVTPEVKTVPEKK